MGGPRGPRGRCRSSDLTRQYAYSYVGSFSLNVKAMVARTRSPSCGRSCRGPHTVSIMASRMFSGLSSTYTPWWSRSTGARSVRATTTRPRTVMRTCSGGSIVFACRGAGKIGTVTRRGSGNVGKRSWPAWQHKCIVGHGAGRQRLGQADGQRPGQAGRQRLGPVRAGRRRQIRTGPSMSG